MTRDLEQFPAAGGSSDPNAVIVGTNFDKTTGAYRIQGHISPDVTTFYVRNNTSHGAATVTADASGNTYGEVTLVAHDNSGDNVLRVASPLDSPAGLLFNNEIFPNWPFTPTTSGDWQGPPATVRDALDELAARVKALEP